MSDQGGTEPVVPPLPPKGTYTELSPISANNNCKTDTNHTVFNFDTGKTGFNAFKSPRVHIWTCIPI